MTIKLGYPCINWSLGLSPHKTFRLASFTEQRFMDTVTENLANLKKTLEWNVAQGFYFFRISSETIPFASHPINTLPWVDRFQSTFQELGQYIRQHDIRISMHPDQFVLINTPSEDVLKKSIADLDYHAQLLDAMELDSTAKIQIHVGGIYGDKPSAIERFVQTYHTLSPLIQKRLVIENDDRLFDLQDCLLIHQKTHIPVLFDNFHHECLNRGESIEEGLRSAAGTWKKKDGRMMIDFSHQERGARKGKHATSIEVPLFKKFLTQAKGFEFDVILEIKDKEKSALQVLPLIQKN